MVEIDDEADDDTTAHFDDAELSKLVADPRARQVTCLLLRGEGLLGSGSYSREGEGWRFEIVDLVRRIGLVSGPEAYLARRRLVTSQDPSTSLGAPDWSAVQAGDSGRLSDEQGRLLQVFSRTVARHFHDHAEWPKSKPVYRRLGRELGRDVDVYRVARAIPAEYGYAGDGTREQIASVSVLSLWRFAKDILTDEFHAFLRAVNLMVARDDAASERTHAEITSDELATLTEGMASHKKLELLLDREWLFGSTIGSEGGVTHEVADLVHRIGPVATIDAYLERRRSALEPPVVEGPQPPPAQLDAAVRALGRTESLMRTVARSPASLQTILDAGSIAQMVASLSAAQRFAESISQLALPLVAAYRQTDQMVAFYQQAAQMAALLPRMEIFDDMVAARAAVQQVVGSPAFAASGILGSQLSVLSDAIARSTGMLVPALGGLGDLRLGVSDVAAGWRRLLEAEERLMPAPIAPALLVTGGRGVLGVNLAAGAGASVQLDVGEDVPAWEGAPLEMRGALLERLREIDDVLPAKLEGAWERTLRPGPDAASQAANSLVELLDWSLRRATEGVDLVAWHAQQGLRSDGVDANGRPTRALKVRYLLRDNPSGDLVEAFARIIGEAYGALQSVKHGGRPGDPVVIQRLIPTIEAALTFVLVR
jgi:hypothetical protein